MPPRRQPRDRSPPQQDPPPPPPLNAENFLNVMYNFFEQRQRHPTPPVGAPEGNQITAIHREFRSQHPPKFEGGDDIQAEEWLTQVERIWELIPCSSQEKASCTISLIQGPAYNWWRSIRTQLDAAGEEVDWEVFTREFKNKYIPQTARDRRLREFMDLRQGGRTVSDYILEFDRLAPYAPHITGDDRLKATHFVQGLRMDIQNAIRAVNTSTWAKATSKALKVEESVVRQSKSFSSGQGSGSGSGSKSVLGKRPAFQAIPPPRPQNQSRSRSAGPA